MSEMFKIIVLTVSTLVGYVSAISIRNAFPSRARQTAALDEARRLLDSR